MSRDAYDQVGTLEQALESNDEYPPSPSALELAHLAARFASDLFASAEFYTKLRLMAQDEAKRLYASVVSATMTRAAEQALFDAFRIGYKSANAELKNTSYHSVKSVLTEMAHKGTLDEVFVRNIERWTQPSTFIDALA